MPVLIYKKKITIYNLIPHEVEEARKWGAEELKIFMLNWKWLTAPGTTYAVALV